MPRDSLPIPFRLNRFNYWRYERVNPLWHRKDRKGIIAPPSRAGDHAHQLCRAEFIKESSSVLAHQDYLEGDKLWQGDKEAQRALKALPPEQRQLLREQHRRKWERKRQKRSWNALLKEIAIDQEVFLDIFKNGHTRSGLAESRRSMSSTAEPLWMTKHLT